MGSRKYHELLEWKKLSEETKLAVIRRKHTGLTNLQLSKEFSLLSMTIGKIIRNSYKVLTAAIKDKKTEICELQDLLNVYGIRKQLNSKDTLAMTNLPCVTELRDIVSSGSTGSELAAASIAIEDGHGNIDVVRPLQIEVESVKSISIEEMENMEDHREYIIDVGNGNMDDTDLECNFIKDQVIAQDTATQMELASTLHDTTSNEAGLLGRIVTNKMLRIKKNESKRQFKKIIYSGLMDVDTDSD